MNAIRLNGILLGIMNVLTKLYLVAVAAFGITLLGYIFGLLNSAAYLHQTLGAMIVAGFMWFLTLVVTAMHSAERTSPPDSEPLTGHSITAPSSSLGSQPWAK